MSSDTPVAIKVMRLCAPYLRELPTPVSASDCLGIRTPPSDTPSLASESPLEPAFLSLPDGFGTIYVGQRFSSYVNVIHSSDVTLTDVTLTAELQSEGAKKFPLEDCRGAGGGGDGDRWRASRLDPGETLDLVFEHFLTGQGSHMLRVCVEYKDPFTGLPKFSRKSYRFTVQDPIAFNYKQSLLHLPGANQPLVELQLSNATPSQLTFTSMTFQPVSGFRAAPMFAAHPPAEAEEGVGGDGEALVSGGTSGAGAGAGAGGSSGQGAGGGDVSPSLPTCDPLDVDNELQRRPHVLPGDIAQFVYAVSATAGPDGWPAGGAVEVGRLTVVWRMRMGEQGVWRSLPIMVRMPPLAPVTLELRSLPAQIDVDACAEVDCVIVNRSSQGVEDVRLEYVPPVGAGAILEGLLSQSVGSVAAGATAKVQLSVLGLAAGWHALTGLSAVDGTTGRILADPGPAGLGQVLVVTNE